MTPTRLARQQTNQKEAKIQKAKSSQFEFRRDYITINTQRENYPGIQTYCQASPFKSRSIVGILEVWQR